MAPLPSDTGSTPSSTTASSPSASPSVPPAAILSPAQIAGVAVGAAAFGFLVFFFIGWCCSCLRNRRRNQSSPQPKGGFRAASRFGNSEKELVQPYHFDHRPFIAEKSTTPPMRPHPTLDTSYNNVDPNLIGVAVSPESMHQKDRPTAAEKTPVSAQSVDSTTALLPSLPPQNLRVAIPKDPSKRRADGVTPKRQQPSIARPIGSELVSPDDMSPRSPDNSVELPCNNPSRQLRLDIAPVTAARHTPVIPKIKRQAAGRESTQTLISPEPMSPVDPKHTALRPEWAPMDPSESLIPSYYYTQLPTPSHIPSASPVQAQAPALSPPPRSATLYPPLPYEPRTPPNRGRATARSTHTTASTLVNTASPPERPRRQTPPPLPKPPHADKPARGPDPEEHPPAVPPKTPSPHKRRPKHTPAAPPRPAPPPRRRCVRESTASSASVETVFDETTAEDEPAAPVRTNTAMPPPKSLSPVPETASPPRAAAARHANAQPPAATPGALNGGTLVAKRKGSGAEDHMKKGLWITESNGRTANERGRFPVRVASKAPPPPVPGQSVSRTSKQSANRAEQPWTPSLTPKRTASGDLVIEVS